MPARNSSMELSSPSQSAEPDAQASRRRSGRVIKAPQKLSPSTGKRRRAGTIDADGDSNMDQEELEDDEDEDSEDEEDEDEPDEEEVREQSRRKRQSTGTGKVPAKRARTSGATSTLAIRSTPKKARARPKKARDSAIALGGLYGDVFGGHDDPETVAGAWLARFKEHESNAVREIVNLVLRSSGCQLVVTNEDIEDPDNCTNKLTDLQDEFQAQNVADYPLIAKGRAAQTFRKSLSAFLIAFIKTIAADKVLFESPELIENVQVWVSAMSSAANRPFRHTATVVSLDIINALAQVAKSQVEAKARMLRQVEGEQKKARGGNKERIKSLQKEAEAIDGSKVALEGLLRDWFDTVFVHRYRDVDPKIRVDCLSSLAEWMDIYPDYFIDGEHLRYLGWCLSDSSAPTRLAVLKGLTTIFHDDKKLPGLRQFTERFRARMVEIATRDHDTSVRTCAVELLDTLREKGLLEPDDIDVIGKLIYDSEPKVRKAVVPFFAASVDESFDAKLEQIGGLEVVEEAFPDANEEDFESPKLDWLRFKALAELMSAYDEADGDVPNTLDDSSAKYVDSLVPAGLESRYTVAAQAVLPAIPVLQEWEVLAGMLLFDHSSSIDGTSVAGQLRQESKLTEREEVLLLDVLNTLVMNVLSDVVEENAPSKKAKKSKAQIRELKETRDLAGQRLADFIPRLLNKFDAAPEAAAAVLRLERLLNLEVYQELRQDSTAFSSLLENIKKQFTEHENQAVIAEASAALAHAQHYAELEEITSGKMSSLWEDTCHSLVALCQGEELRTRGSMNASMANGISNTLLRIANLASISNPIEALEKLQAQKTKKARRSGPAASKLQEKPPVAPISIILELLLRGVPVSNIASDVDAIEDALTSSAIKSLFFYFLWHARALGEAEPLPSDEAVTSLVQYRVTAFKYLQRILRHRRSPDDVRLAAAGLLLDLHSAFKAIGLPAPAEDEEDDDSALAALGRPMDDAAQTELVRLFAAAERDFAQKTHRSLPTPDEDEDDPADDNDAEPEDPDADEDEHEGSSAQVQHARLLAEQRFCTFASKIVLALAAGCVEEPLFPNGARKSSALRKRLVRNNRRLGTNFREICEKLEMDKIDRKSKVKTKAKNSNQAKASALSRETVDDEDDEDDAEEQLDEAEEEERRTREADAAGEEGSEAVDGEEAEAESIVGD